MKAEGEQYATKDFFDFTIVNDDLEYAYNQLKDYCLNVYWSSTVEDDE